MVRRLKSEGFWVRGVDLKLPEYSSSPADEFLIMDLRNQLSCAKSLTLGQTRDCFDQVYQFAADMGGAGYIFTGDNDANVMHNSALINLNVVHYATKFNVKKVRKQRESRRYSRNVIT